MHITMWLIQEKSHLFVRCTSNIQIKIHTILHKFSCRFQMYGSDFFDILIFCVTSTFAQSNIVIYQIIFILNVKKTTSRLLVLMETTNKLKSSDNMHFYALAVNSEGGVKIYYCSSVHKACWLPFSFVTKFYKTSTQSYFLQIQFK